MRRRMPLTLGLMVAFAVGFPISAITAEEVIDTSTLGTSGRGVVIQTELVRGKASAHGVGDVDGDGLSDLLVSMKDDRPEKVRDIAALVFGRPELEGVQRLDRNFPRAAFFGVLGELNSTRMDLSPAGDVNADGFADFFFAYSGVQRPGREGTGEAYLVFGSARLEGEHFGEEVGNQLPGITFFSSDPQDVDLGSATANIVSVRPRASSAAG